MKTSSDLINFMDTPEWKAWFVKVLEEIKNDISLANGHVGSYG